MAQSIWMKSDGNPVWIVGYGIQPASSAATAVQIHGYGGTPASGSTPIKIVGHGPTPPSGATAMWITSYGGKPGVAPPPTVPVNITPPVITGTPQVGQTLSASTGTWSNSPTSYAYQWWIVFPATVIPPAAGSAAKAGATSNAFVIDAPSATSFLGCMVTATNSNGSTSAWSNVLGPVTAAPAGFATVSSVAVVGLTTSATPINTTGANLLVAVTCGYNGWVPGFADSYNNVWASIVTNVGTGPLTVWYCQPISAQVGPNHTFTASGYTTSVATAVAAFSGAAATGVFDVTSTNVASGGATAAITPTAANSLVLALASTGASGLALSPPFTMLAQQAWGSGVNMGVYIAYLMQANPAAVADPWTATINRRLISFRPAASPLPPTPGPFALVASASGKGTATVANTNASPINTTGADLLVAVGALAGNTTTTTAMTDSYGNAWTLGPNLTGQLAVYYCRPAIVGTGHTFTLQCNGSYYPSISMAAFCGSAAFALDQSSVAASGTAGAITPSVPGALVIAGASAAAAITATPAGFTVQATLPYQGASNTGSALAARIQSAAASVNPVWTSTLLNASGVISFKPGTGAAPTWTPANLPGLVAWYDAQDAASLVLSGSNVTQWNDKSGKGLNVVQATPAAQPTLAATGINGRPALQFSGAQVLQASLAAGAFTSGLAYYFVTLIATTGQNTSPISRAPNAAPYVGPLARYGISVMVGGSTYYNGTTYNTGSAAPAIWGLRYTPASDRYQDWLNGNPNLNVAAVGQSANWTDSASTITVGRRIDGAVPITGFVGEAIACTQLSDADRFQLESYLATKWGF